MKKYQNSKKYNKDHLLFNFSDQRKQMTTEFFKNVSRILTEKYLADFNHCPLFLQIFDFIGHFLAAQLNFVLIY